jgi:hypothetical protein
MYAMMTASRPDQRARWIEAVRYFISNPYFCELVQCIRVDAPKRFDYALFNTFDSLPDVRTQFNDWVVNGLLSKVPEQGYRAAPILRTRWTPLGVRNNRMQARRRYSRFPELHNAV